MICPHCGSAQTQVVETRPWQDGAMIKRRRECSDGHRFNTFEIGEQLAGTLDKACAPSARALHKTQALRLRNKRIVHAVTSGRTIREVSREFNVSESLVSGIISVAVPEFNARMNGQLNSTRSRKDAHGKSGTVGDGGARAGGASAPESSGRGGETLQRGDA